MPILDSGSYPAIRAAIDVSLTRAQLPDDTIAQDIFLGAAELEVTDRVSGAAGMTGAQLAAVKRAIVYLTAARLVPSVYPITSFAARERDMNYARQVTMTAEEMVAALNKKADDEILDLNSQTFRDGRRPTMFAVASGGRIT